MASERPQLNLQTFAILLGRLLFAGVFAMGWGLNLPASKIRLLILLPQDFHSHTLLRGSRQFLKACW